MSAGLADHSSGPESPGPVNKSEFEGLGQTAVESARITNGGEATTKHALEDGFGLDRDSSQRAVGHGFNVHRGDDWMHMGVDESGEHGPAAAVDHLHVISTSCEQTVANFHEAVVLRPHRSVRAKLAGLGVEVGDVLDDKPRHDSPPIAVLEVGSGCDPTHAAS